MYYHLLTFDQDKNASSRFKNTVEARYKAVRMMQVHANEGLYILSLLQLTSFSYGSL